MEEVVKRAVEDGTQDGVLAQLVEVTRASILEGRPLFSNLMEEPVFYRRHFKRWVREIVKERQATTDVLQEELKNALVQK
jgi:hypothetical protein